MRTRDAAAIRRGIILARARKSPRGPDGLPMFGSVHAEPPASLTEYAWLEYLDRHLGEPPRGDGVA